VKIAVIGGGSSYTPELVQGLAQRAAELGLDEVVLVDPDAERLGAVVAFCRRVVSRLGSPVRVSDATRERALREAAAVVTQLRVGGQPARHQDIQMGLRHDLIGQETTGVGGFAKALRTVPVMLEIARELERVAPEAWLINFTNPSGLVTEAVQRNSGVKCVGLCNVPIETQMDLAAALKVAPDEVELDWVGLNHLGFIRRVMVRGEDWLPRILARLDGGELDSDKLLDFRYPRGFLPALGMLPTSYVRYFLATREMLAELKSAKQSRAEEVMAIDAELFACYRDPKTDTLPSALQKRGGAWYSRLAVDVVAALGRAEPRTLVVNTANGDAVADLPADAVVEVPCRVSQRGVEPLPRGKVDELALGLMRSVKAYERLAIDACLTRDRAAAWRALTVHPLVGSAAKAGAVVNDLIGRGLL
jgi:6-phospho-beta-glucosidase